MVSRVFTTDQIIVEFKKIWNDRYDYSLVNYIGQSKLVSIICKKHDKFDITPYKHLKGSGCYQCGRESAGLKNQIKSTKNSAWFIEKAIAVHGHKYDYSNTVYVHSHKEVLIICPMHGEFKQIASYHLQGCGCKSCQYEYKRQNYTTVKSDLDIKNLIKLKTNGKVSLVATSGLNFKSNVELYCETHGLFKTTLKSIWHSKFICHACKNETLSILNTKSNDDYIKLCIKKHGNKYDYSKTVYRHSNAKATFICKKHGEFEQFVGAHASGSGCPKCRHRISKPCQLWLSSFNNPNILSERQIEGKFVDGYDPITNTIYEFYGDYWHGNPNLFEGSLFNKRTKCTMEDLYNKTIARSQYLKSKGYNMVEIWEFDWKNLQKLH